MAYPSDSDIIKLLGNDSIKNAEEFTGKATEDDKATSNLGFMMHVYDNMVKEKALREIGDTFFNMDWLAYCEMIEKFGFGLMVEDFAPDGGNAIRLYYHEKDGILLVTDSHQGNRNSALAYYNWKPSLLPKEERKDPNVAELVPYYKVISSGGFFYPEHTVHDIPDDVADPAWKTIVWSGYHDAREAIGFNMNRLREYGTFIPIWKEKPYLWLLGHWEKHDEAKYDQINQDRFEKLPQWVKDNIKGISK